MGEEEAGGRRLYDEMMTVGLVKSRVVKMGDTVMTGLAGKKHLS